MEVRADALAHEVRIRSMRCAVVAFLEENVVPSFDLALKHDCAVHLAFALERAWRSAMCPEMHLDVTPPSAADDLNKYLVYYIAGWLASWVARQARTSSQREHACRLRVTKERARADHLPIQLTEARERFDGLQYPSTRFFELVLRMESIFAFHLTLDNALAHGRNLVQRVKEHAKKDLPLRRLAGDVNIDLPPLVDAYSRMRGKDFCCKLRNNTRGDSQATSTRQRLSALADEARRRANAMLEEEAES